MISANSEQCVEFYYYQDPSVVGTLNIYAKLSMDTVASIGFPLWTEPFISNSSSSNGWKIGQVSLGHTVTNVPYQVIFEEYVQANKPGNFQGTQKHD